MANNKLTKNNIKRFSISYSEAKRLGITDEDLKYISETDPNSYRISIPAFDKRRTKLVHDLLIAIKTKYEMVEKINKDKKEYEEKEKTLKDTKSKITKYSLVRDGIELYLSERKKDYERGFIQITTYEQDIHDFTNSSYLVDYGIYDAVINDINDNYAQQYVNYLWDKISANGVSIDI